MVAESVRIFLFRVSVPSFLRDSGGIKEMDLTLLQKPELLLRFFFPWGFFSPTKSVCILLHNLPACDKTSKLSISN